MRVSRVKISVGGLRPARHSGLTGDASGFGSDRVSFSFASPTAMPANPVRSFRSFTEAARENADSRLKAGLHFLFATDAGLAGTTRDAGQG